MNVKEVGTDWVSLCWKRPEVRRTTASPFLMYKVEAWLCGEGAYWVEVGRSPIPQFDIFNLKPRREYYFRRVAKRHKGPSIKYVRTLGGEGGHEKTGYCGQGGRGGIGLCGRPHLIQI